MNLLRAIAAFCGVALALACAPAQAQTKVNFRLDWSIYGAHAPFYLALEKGLFAKEGLDVNVQEGQGSGVVMQLIAQGGEPIGFVDYSTMINGVEQGMPIKAVMRVVSDVLCIMSHGETPIRSPKELEGKIIAFAPSESSGLALPALLNAQGVDIKTISILNPAMGAKNALFLQNRADAIPGNINVQLAQLEAQGAKVAAFKYSDFGVNMMAQGVVVNNAFLEKNGEAVRGFLRATKAAYEATRADPGQAVDAVIKRLPEQRRNREVLLRQIELTIPGLVTKNTADKPFGYMDERDWEETQTLMLKYIGLKRAVPVKDLYTNDYLPK
jgi:NitT/TauT family transport system substrate-binding protein